MTTNIARFPLLAAEHKLNSLKQYTGWDKQSEQLADTIRETITTMNRDENYELNDAFNIVKAVGALQSYLKTGEHRYVTLSETLCTPYSTIKEEYLAATQRVA